MALYVKDGNRMWHKVDPSKQQKVHGRDSHVLECGFTIVCACPSVELAEAPAGLCKLCVLDPTEEQKKEINSNYLVSSS